MTMPILSLFASKRVSASAALLAVRMEKRSSKSALKYFSEIVSSSTYKIEKAL